MAMSLLGNFKDQLRPIDWGRGGGLFIVGKVMFHGRKSLSLQLTFVFNPLAIL